MTISRYFQSGGLALDIAGVILLFRYGLPSKYPKRESYLLLEADDDSPESVKIRKRITRGAYGGVSLLVLGFSLQLVGTLIR